MSNNLTRHSLFANVFQLCCNWPPGMTYKNLKRQVIVKLIDDRDEMCEKLQRNLDKSTYSYALSQELIGVIGGVKISHDLRERIEMVGTAYEDMGEGESLSIQSNVVELFNHITPEQMAEFQGLDNQIGPILQWVKDGKFPS